MPTDATDDSSLRPFRDLDRPPLDAAALRRSLVRDGSPWTSVEVLDSTGSTNADLVAAGSAGRAVAGSVLVAEGQTAGRGRLARPWQSPPRAGLTFSVLLEPSVPVARWGWLPLVAGLAAVEGIRAASGLETSLKWPNDVLAADGRKLGGVLAERVDLENVPHAVVGMGLNVTNREDELPVETATSLALAGADRSDRQPVLVAVLRALAVRLAEWEEGADVTAAYRSACSTVGRPVRVALPVRPSLVGTAVDVDGEGRLVVVDVDGARTAVAAGDVVHVR